VSPRIAGLVTVLLVTGSAAFSQGTPQEREKLQGTWEVLTAAAGGEDLSENVGDKDRLVFQGNRVTLHDKFRAREFEIALDPTRDPRSIDLSATERGKTETCLGIYRLEGDRLHFTYAIPGEPRPTDFVSRKGQKSFVFVLKRLPPGEQTAREKLRAAEEAGHAARQRKDYAAATQAYQQAVALARETLGPRNARTNGLMDRLALVYQGQGFHARAEPLWEEALSIAEEMNAPEKLWR
jgi:uncharacterized protein (TIGR03067 family)